ncbi:MAG: LysE family transporter [Pseudomonadota bacterium]
MVAQLIGVAGFAASSFGVAFSGALMPGPLLVATMDLSLRHGARSGPLLVLGHGLLELGLVIMLAAGLGPIISHQAVVAAVALAGAGLLWWMAVGMARAEGLGTLSGAKLQGRLHPFWAGIVLSLFNPYWAVWWATIGLGYIVASRRFGAVGLAAFFCAHICADLLWYTLVSAAVARGKKTLLSARSFRRLARGCATLLAASGGFFAYTGARLLL